MCTNIQDTIYVPALATDLANSGDSQSLSLFTNRQLLYSHFSTSMAITTQQPSENMLFFLSLLGWTSDNVRLP